MRKIIVICLVFVFLSCSSDEKIFEIKNKADFIELLKLTNIEKIEKKSSNILTSTEIINSKYEYKNFGTLYENEHFKVIGILCLKQSDKFNHFLARTIQKGDSKIKGSFLISSYDEKNNIFCSGYLDKDLNLKRICKDFILEKRIDSEGKIY